MKRNDVEREVVQILRQASLSGSDREIDIHNPLGELGLGLDSLALAEFVTAVEKRFQIELADNIWTERGQLTLQYFVDLILQSVSAVPSVAQEKYPDIQRVPAGDHAGAQKTVQIARQLDQGNEKNGTAVRLLRKILKFLYHRETFIILEFKLSEQQLPSFPSPLNLILREASVEDAIALSAFWESFDYRTFDKKEMNMELFRERLGSGYTCLTAWLDDKIVGMDWLLDKGYDCPFTGLKFSWPQDTCYGGELYEHKMYQGRGVGLTLLAFSLTETKKKGYQRQVTWVTAKNVKMLIAAIQMFGFKKIGDIDITRILHRPFSTWKISGRSGRGGKVIL